jgi:hypothetical protein
MNPTVGLHCYHATQPAIIHASLIYICDVGTVSLYVVELCLIFIVAGITFLSW